MEETETIEETETMEETETTEKTETMEETETMEKTESTNVSPGKTSQNGKEIDKFTVGDILKATIKKINICSMDLTIGTRKTWGKVHISEIVDSIKDGTNPLSDYKVSQEINVRCIGIKYYIMNKRNSSSRIPYLECTLKPSKFSLENEELVDSTKQEYQVGDKVIAYITSISGNCIFFKIDHSTKGRAHHLNITKSLEVIRCPKKHFGRSCGYNAEIIDIEKDNLLELSLIDEVGQVKEGQSAIAKIIDKDKSDGLVVRLARGHKGTINFSGVTDEFKEDPLADFKKGQYIVCYVNSITDKENCQLSLRD